MISIFQAVVLGVVEGVTEFLPISSTAHLVIVSELLKIDQSVFVKTFEIAIQSGAILAVVVLYVKKFFDIEVLKRVCIAFVPTAVLGLLFYTLIKTYLIGNMSVILTALALGGVFLILFETYFRKEDVVSDIKSITYKNAFYIGLFQSVAMIPGVSRSAATIVGGLLLGVKRDTIIEFSFLLAVPTMLAATGLDLIKSSGSITQSEFGILGIGFVTSFIMAIASIKFLLRFIKTRTFVAFGVYRVLLVLLIVGGTYAF